MTEPWAVLVHRLVCRRCAHGWYPRRPTPPRVCPRCKDPHYNEAYIQGPRPAMRKAAWRTA